MLEEGGCGKVLQAISHQKDNVSVIAGLSC